MSKQNLTYVFSIFGYIALALQWSWVAVHFLPLVLGSSWLDNMTTPSQPSEPVNIPEALSPAAVIFSLIAVILAIGAGVYAIFKLPQQTTKIAERSTGKAAKLVAKQITAKRKTTKNYQVKLGHRLQLAIKLSLALIGFGLLYSVQLLENSMLDFAIVTTVGWLLLPWPILWFGLAYVIDRSSTKLS